MKTILLSIFTLITSFTITYGQGIDDQLPSRIGYGRHGDPANRISSLLAIALRSNGSPDVLRHKNVISTEFSTDGMTWNNWQTDDWENVLDGVNSTGWLLDYNDIRLVIDLNGTWIRPSAFLIGADWGGTDPSYYLTIESSSDNSSWTQRLPSTYSGSSNSAQNIFFIGNIGVDRYIRLTLKTEAPAGKTFNLKQISAFTQRFVGLSNDVANPFFFDSNQNVGLGTSTPDPNFKLSVNGSIRSKEVKVEANWSDFVFYEDYELRTLEEVEKHINERGHLPEIPNEAEVTENGINLGEMDSKLLQKIEELTLYLIDMNKQMQQLKSENQELKEKVNRLENE